MNVIIDHLINNKKLYFIASIVVLLAMISQIRHPGFDSSFENLGIKDNEYVNNASYIDSIFDSKHDI
jgi:predicted RND superfamily exporter protein